MSKKDTSKPRHLQKRPERRSMEQTGPLVFPEYKKDPNYEYRWVNVKDWNFELKLQNDWVPVTDDGDEYRGDIKIEASQMGSVVKKSVGNAIEAILCRKPKAWYEEDQREKTRVNQEKATERAQGSHRYDKQMDINYSNEIGE